MMFPVLIHGSQNYDKFRVIKGNRPISKKKVLRIVKDVQQGVNLFPYCPIIVHPSNDLGPAKFDIIDGQHRFTACKELGHPIYYVVAKKITLQDIAKLNSNTDKWKNQDFIDCYTELGNDSYKLLQVFMKEYKVSLSVAVSLLKYDMVAGGGSVLAEFKEGKFECKHYTKASQFIEQHDELFGRFSFYRDRNLLQASKTLMKHPDYDHERMKTQIGFHTKLMDKQSTSRIYRLMLDKIYNRNHPKPISLL